MFWHDKKTAMTTIMARRGPKGGEVISGPAPMKAEESMTEPGVKDGRHAAAQDVMAAMHEKSPEKLMHALANFHDLHAASMSDSEPEAPLEE